MTDFEKYNSSNENETRPSTPPQPIEVEEAPSLSEPVSPDDQTSSSPMAQVGGAIKETLETIIPAIIIALLINLFLAQATRVYGQSMEPNLHTDERLIIEKVSYKVHPPDRHDIIVLKVRDDAKELLIKRVIGLPGETVEVRDGNVYVDGQMLDEPYLAQPTLGRYGPTVVPPFHVFVMGDNRNASNDSRSFGAIPYDNIIGKAWVSYWPLNDVGMVH